jgi:hypothetical protein
MAGGMMRTYNLVEVSMRVLFGLLVAVVPALCQTATPFAVTEVSRRIEAPGQPAKESKFFFAINRSGTAVSVDLDPTSGGIRQIIDPVKHQTLLVNPNSRTAVVTPYRGWPQSGSEDACEQRFRYMTGAIVSVDQSAGMIQGVPMQRISVNLPKMGTSMEILVAPSLACHMIDVRTFRDGVLVNSQTAENLQLGDPDPHLFEVPVDYQVTNGALSFPTCPPIQRKGLRL